MRIALHDYSGHPFQAELAAALAARGHHVDHISCSSYVSGKGFLDTHELSPDSLRFSRLSMGDHLSKHRIGKRLLQEVRYAKQFRQHARAQPFDCLVMCNVPLVAHFLIARWAKRAGHPMVFWHQDVYSQAMAQQLRRRFGPLAEPAAFLLDRMERFAARASQRIVVIASTFLGVHTRWGTIERVTIQPNWAPLQEITPMPRDNAWARRHDLVGRPVVLYSGTIGFKHDPDNLVRLHHELVKRVPDLRMVVVSQGAAADYLHAHDADLLVLPFQAFADLPSVLGSADVLLTILEPEASDYSVPSKTLSYLCAGRPVLALLPHGNPAFTIVRDAGGLPYDLATVDMQTIAEHVQTILEDPDDLARRGRLSRAYAEEYFDIDEIATTFEKVLSLTR